LFELSETKIQVAVVDDDESFARAIGRLLRAAGFGTAIYNSTEAFLRSFAARPVNCVVLDIQFAGMSGPDLGRRLFAIGTMVPIVFVTALEDEETCREAREINRSALLHKPVSGQALIGAIRHAVKAT
jgi:FixJ family two-component response regulator